MYYMIAKAVLQQMITYQFQYFHNTREIFSWNLGVVVLF